MAQGRKDEGVLRLMHIVRGPRVASLHMWLRVFVMGNAKVPIAESRQLLNGQIR